MNSMSARAVKDLDGIISQSCSVKNSLGIFGLGVVGRGLFAVLHSSRHLEATFTPN